MLSGLFGRMLIRNPYDHNLVSDATGMYLNVLSIAVMSLVICIILTITDTKRKDQPIYSYWLRTIASYYLASQLLIYGFSKFFKWQFYLPEPNTLYTPLADIPRDLLYWSVMGTSRSYSLFLGSLEILAALLLFFRRTRMIGGIFSAAIMLNVLMINLSFDISVKIFSTFLLLTSIGIALPGKRSIPFFIKKRKTGYIIFKTIVIMYIIADAMFIYFKTGNYNDDKSARPKFHGAYDVSTYIRNGDTLTPLLTDHFRWRRAFVHRRGYFIIQSMSDVMTDYELKIDTVRRSFTLDRSEDSVKYILQYEQINDSSISISGIFLHDSIYVLLNKLDPDKVTLLKNEFHWTSDD